MKSKITNYFMITLPAVVIFFFALWGFVLPDQAYSTSERRVLASRPAIETKDVLNGKYMTAFETYTLDQFPMRESFRKLKALSTRYLFGKKDDNGYYLVDGYLSKLEYPLNEVRVNQSIQKQQKIYDDYLKGTDCKLYQAIIPDKNYFLAQKNGYPTMDYERYVTMVKEGTNYANYINVFDDLSLEGYYYTDQHFRQECLEKVVSTLGKELGADFYTEFALDYTINELDNPFYGAYKDQAALPVRPDKLNYLTNDEVNACIVTSLNTGIPKKAQMYDMEKSHGRDPYEMFLSGSDAFLVIENPNATSDRELVMFRDSFGSSLAPLLVHGYSKITLVDLRYVRSEMLGQLIDFGKQDILFIYSTLVF